MSVGNAGPPANADEAHERARRLLAANEPQSALELMQRVVEAAPGHLPYWLSLAAVLRSLQRHGDELDALERALALDPTHLIVLLQKGALLDLMQRPRSAAGVYTHALQSLAPGTRLPAAVLAHVEHARRRVAENSARLAALLAERLAAVPQCDAASEDRMRFDRCIDRLLGRTRIYAPDPTFMLFPFLANYEFLPRGLTPWIGQLEAATAVIREELLAVLSDDREGLEPYIAYDGGVPLNQWSELNHSRRWSAYFLWNQGRREESHLARCPRTAALLAALPQVDVPGRGPTAFFSLLDAHTTIPPHTGVTNTRLTVHLPLIVPPGCRFRVGGDVREWRVGTAWAFDDTIEHEAWNDSAVARAILIFDVWNPQLTPLERGLLREATAALAEYNDAEESSVGAAS